MKKIVALSFLLASHSLFAAQTIQIHSQLPAESPSAALLLVIYDIDQGRKTPYFMNLTPGQTLQTFHIDGNHFQILQWEIQAPNLKFSPCAPTQVINNQSLIVNMMGKIESNGLHCALREVAIIPQLSTPTPVTTSSPTITAAVTVDPNAGNKVIANYLTALGKSCQKGTFIADFESQTVTYTILGMNADHCAVTIGTNKLPPLTCNFNQNDIALLASPTEIDGYTQGTAKYSENSLSARIMKARCKTESPAKVTQ